MERMWTSHLIYKILFTQLKYRGIMLMKRKTSKKKLLVLWQIVISKTAVIVLPLEYWWASELSITIEMQWKWGLVNSEAKSGKVRQLPCQLKHWPWKFEKPYEKFDSSEVTMLWGSLSHVERGHVGVPAPSDSWEVHAELTVSIDCQTCLRWFQSSAFEFSQLSSQKLWNREKLSVLWWRIDEENKWLFCDTKC